MVFVLDVTSAGPFDVPWEAELRVLSPDVAHLMREGFHRDETNITREKGFTSVQRTIAR